MRPAALTDLRFFLDRGLGAHIVPVALRAHGWILTTMDERYGADRSQRIEISPNGLQRLRLAYPPR